MSPRKFSPLLASVYVFAVGLGCVGESTSFVQTSASAEDGPNGTCADAALLARKPDALEVDFGDSYREFAEILTREPTKLDYGTHERRPRPWWCEPFAATSHVTIHTPADLGLQRILSVLRAELETTLDGTAVLNLHSIRAAPEQTQPRGGVCEVLYQVARCAIEASATSLVVSGFFVSTQLVQKLRRNYPSEQVVRPPGLLTEQFEVPLYPFKCENGLSGRLESPYHLYWIDVPQGPVDNDPAASR